MFYIYIIKVIVYFAIVGFVVLFLSFWVIELLMMLLSSLSKERMYAPTRWLVLVNLVREIKKLKEKEGLNKNCKFLEIGSGNGRVIRFLSMFFKECEFYGVEVSVILYVWSKILTTIITPFRKNLKLIHADALKMPLKRYDIIYVFGQVQFMKKLADKFSTDLKKGAVVMSWMFEIPNFKKHGFKLIDKVKIGDLIVGTNYLYVYQKI